MTNEQQTKVVHCVNELRDAMKAFILACPDFPDANKLVTDLAVKSANLESVLHWDCGIWELGLPRLSTGASPVKPDGSAGLSESRVTQTDPEKQLGLHDGINQKPK